MTENIANSNSICPLTGLPKCTELHRIVADEIAFAKKAGTALALIMIDIDHLATFNNNYGYTEGDKVLIRLGEILKENKRVNDNIIRCKPADFAMTLRDANLSQAYLTAQRILDIVENEKITVDGKEVKVTASAGLSEFSPSMSVEEFLQAADTTLRYAKNCGRNRVQSSTKK